MGCIFLIKKGNKRECEKRVAGGGRNKAPSPFVWTSHFKNI